MNFVNKRLDRPLPTYPAISERRGDGLMWKDVFLILFGIGTIVALFSKLFLINFAMILVVILCVPFFIIFTLMEELWNVFSYVSSKVKKDKPE